jgi:hypothetical protein
MAQFLPSKTRWLSWLLWTTVNAFAFPLANTLAGDHVIPPGIAGDLIYGLIFGALQTSVLYVLLHAHRRILFGWLFASSIGFAAGIFLAIRVSLALTNNQILLPIVFGIIVGAVLGIAQWLILRLTTNSTNAALWWIPVSMLAWVVGESIAFHSGFVAVFVVLVGAGIGAVTGVALIFLSGATLSLEGKPLSALRHYANH